MTKNITKHQARTFVLGIVLGSAAAIALVGVSQANHISASLTLHDAVNGRVLAVKRLPNGLASISIQDQTQPVTAGQVLASPSNDISLAQLNQTELVK
jgi:hypothetical protein